MALDIQKVTNILTFETKKSCTVSASTDVITSSGHGLQTNDIIQVSYGQVPTPLAIETNYYVIYITADTFKVSLTENGSPINITANGTNVAFLRNVEPINDGCGITNLTQTGTGIITLVAREQFGYGWVSSIRFIVLTGTFSSGNKIQTTDGGTFYIYNTTATDTSGAIIVTGTNIVDSTSTLSLPISNSIEKLFYTPNSIIKNLKYIKIDNEWMMTITGSTTTLSKTFTVASSNRIYAVTHGLVTGNVIRLTTTGTLPTGLSTNTSYYVTKVDDNYIRVSLTYAGSDVVITSPSGSGTHTLTKQNEATIKRGIFGTTATSHTDNTQIYALDTDLFKAIAAYDTSQAWGLCDTSSGRCVIDTSIVLGSPFQSEKSLLVSSMECVEISNYLYRCGESTYGTISQFGVGWIDSGAGIYTGLFMNGSLVTCNAYYHFKNCLANDFSTTLFMIDDFISIGEYNAMSCNFNCYNATNYMFFRNADACKFYKCCINNQRISVSSTNLDWYDVGINYKILQESIYFLTSGGNAELRNVIHADPQYDLGSGAFAATGIKTFINCKLNTAHGHFWADNLNRIDKKIVYVKTETRQKTPVPNSNVSIRYINQTTYQTATTDSNGLANIPVTFNEYWVGESRDIEIFVRKSGYKDVYYKYHVDDLSDQLYINLILEPHRYIDKV